MTEPGHTITKEQWEHAPSTSVAQPSHLEVHTLPTIRLNEDQMQELGSIRDILIRHNQARSSSEPWVTIDPLEPFNP